MQWRACQVMESKKQDTNGREHDRRLSLDRGVWGHLLLHPGVSSR